VRIFSSVSAANNHVHSGTKHRVLVPTMGALHKGHISLVRLARENAGGNGEVAVSIFVNPLQFEPGSDFDKYPRTESADEELCREEGVDVLFRPKENEIYAVNRSVFVEETALSNRLCGKSRPGHFRGVCTVVAKLFHILAPHAAVFGEKDFQQLAIIRRMARDLNFPIEIIGAPTVREADGLALSSRNQYLDTEERAQAPILRAALLKASEQGRSGELSSAKIVEQVRTTISNASRARIDYVELVSADDFQPRKKVERNSLLAVAVFFGKTRLIDNILL
jgi:pantoate--beta-alanine ligase